MAPSDQGSPVNAQVIPIRRPVAVSPRHPSLHVPATVTLDRLQCQLIASLLQSTRHLVPQPQAVDAAIDILMGRKP